MVPSPSPDPATEDETVVEFVVRERLTKDQVVELLTSLGGQRHGSRDEVGERLLAMRGLKVKEVVSMLTVDELKLVARRFDVPEGGKPTTASGFLNSIMSDEKSTFTKRVEDFASKQRAPRPRSGPAGTLSSVAATVVIPQPASVPVTAKDTKSASAASEVVEFAHPRAPVTPPAPEPPKLATRSTPLPPLLVGGEPVEFEDLCRFLESYTFTKRWDEEVQYEAELGGAISGRFRGQKVTHQMAVGGTKADIVACGAVIEIKYPKTRQPLQTLSGQVDDYQKLFGHKVIVVLCSGGLRETQAVGDTASTLTERGAKVFIK